MEQDYRDKLIKISFSFGIVQPNINYLNYYYLFLKLIYVIFL